MKNALAVTPPSPGRKCSSHIGTGSSFRVSSMVLALLLAFSVVALLASAALPQKEFYIQPVDETVRNGRRDGFEPHIIAGPSMDGTGEWYYYDSPSGLLSPGVSNTRRPGNCWISKDYGLTWEFKEKDNALIDLLPQDPGGSGDTFIAISESGALFHTDLYLSSASVDMSLDGGENWYLNPVASDYILDDRQWLDIGPARDGIGDETLYFCFNQLFPLGLVMTKIPILTNGPIDNYLWRPCNGGAPITTDVSARDVFCVDEESGIIYISNYAPGAGELEVWKSTNGGDSFSQHHVLDAPSRAQVQNIFTVIDTDIEGNVYITYSSRDHIWLAVSTDEAQSWTIHQITSTKSVKALPWIAAGDGGMVGMAWYESEKGDEGSPDSQSESWWDLNAAICYNALEEEPSFEILTVDPDIHYGGVQTTGTGGGSDRDLGDFLCVDIDSHGRLLISYGEDGDDGPNNRMSYPMFAAQINGPFLRGNKGPVFQYDLDKSDNKVSLELEDVRDLGGLAITNITVDWGDGSSGAMSNEYLKASHSYPDSKGNYNLTIQVTNEIGMRTTVVVPVTIDVEDEWTIMGLPGGAVVGTPLLILVAVGLAVLISRKKKKEEKIPEAEKIDFKP